MPNDFYFQEIKHNIFNKSAETKVDRFAFGLCGPNGTYIEIGAHKPSRRSNTISLEQLGWKGFGIEIMDMDGHRIDKVLVKLSEQIRSEMEEEQ